MSIFSISKYYLLLIILVLCTHINAYNQSINEEKKQIIGTWISEDGAWTFIFGADMKCKEYFDGRLDAVYVYKITPGNSGCGIKAKIDIHDKTISFLQLNNIKTHEQICYEVNGISTHTLSLSGYLLPEPSVFNRKTRKQSSVTKSEKLSK